jgi:hypothetical protein
MVINIHIKLYKGILNPLPQHRKAVKDGIEQKLKNLGFVYHGGNAYCKIELKNNIELMQMFSWLKELGFGGGEVSWV